MSNKIAIDDLFREKLSGGKEQLNLGAWANMERMLDGQNPYSSDEQEPKRKRRILPFLILFTLLTTAISAGYLLLNKKDNIAQDLSQSNVNTANNNNKTPELTTASNLDNKNTPNQITPNQINSHSEKGTNNLTAETAHSAKHPKEKRVSKGKNNFNHDNPARATMHEVALASSDPGIVMTQDGNRNQKSNKFQGSKKDNAETIIAANAVNNEIADNAPKMNNKENKTTKSGTKIDTKEYVTKNRNGSVQKVTYDTLDMSPIEIANTKQTIDPVADNTPKDKNYKYHPRYVGDVVASEPPIVLNNTINSEAAPVEKTPHLLSASDAKDKKKNKEEKTGVFNALGAFTSLALTKIGDASSDFFRMFTVLDPGISLGVNAALFNTKHNYGGFHAGLTNHTAISETFSIMTELKVFIRNNSGFTINDIKTHIKTKDTPDTTIAGQTAYRYQVDSMTKRYNFKNFMSLELPVMLSARFNNLSVYGGPNFVYNMKFKINEIDKSYVVNKEDIVATGTNYSYPDDKGMLYTRNDFGSRFGIGYAIGASYNFNPKIYLDIRLSKVMWDNTKTNSQREISNGVTKVPFTQLSLGYKFKNK